MFRKCRNLGLCYKAAVLYLACALAVFNRDELQCHFAIGVISLNLLRRFPLAVLSPPASSPVAISVSPRSAALLSVQMERTPTATWRVR